MNYLQSFLFFYGYVLKQPKLSNNINQSSYYVNAFLKYIIYMQLYF